MRKVKISGYGYALPEQIVQFGTQIRYRLARTEDYWGLITAAVGRALAQANLKIEDIDCIVAGMGTTLQPIPCNAALIQECLGKHLDMPAFDINSTCTSFITALDTMSYLIDAKRYNKVLLVSGDIASAALNPKEKESYELFSDACTAFVLESTEENCGVVHSKLKTWSEGAHYTEIPKGGSINSPFKMTEENIDDYCFTMQGLSTVRLTLNNLPVFLDEYLTEFDRTQKDFSVIVPHQASRILPKILEMIGFYKEQYLNLVGEYGNMVSASVPFGLCKSLERGRIQSGDEVLLLGTAAGLTINFLTLKF